MDFTDAEPFLRRHHRMVVTTHRPDGHAHASIVLGGQVDDCVAFVVRDDTVKLQHLRRDPRCTALAVTADWSAWVAVEGTATIQDWDGTPAEQMRQRLRAVFKAAGGTHGDWDEFDRVMREERRAIVLVSPQRVYGLRSR